VVDSALLFHKNRVISVVRWVGWTTAWLFNASINPVEILTVNGGS
jgi:hypothetical protein